MSAQTNDFQELVAALTEIIGKDKCDSPGWLPDGSANGKLREVDIIVHGEVAGHEVLVGIEVRARAEVQDITFVDDMHGKHAHLPTSKLVLVSKSGFSADALVKAEFLNIKAITPSEVTPGFIGEIVNNLDSLVSKYFSLEVETVNATVDPPIMHPGTTAADVGAQQIYRADETVIGTMADLVQAYLRGFTPDQPAFMAATGDEKEFKVRNADPKVDGEPIYLMGVAQPWAVTLSSAVGDSGTPISSPILHRITQLEIKGKATVHVEEVALNHGDYDGTPYSSAKATPADETHHWVLTEGKDGLQGGIRVVPTGKPSEAKFHKVIFPRRGESPPPAT